MARNFGAVGRILVVTILIPTILIPTMLFAPIREEDLVAAIVITAIVASSITGRRSFGGGGLQWTIGWGAEIGENVLRLNLTLSQGCEIVGNRFFFIQSDLAGVGADEALIKDSAGKLVEVFVFEGAQHARADFCGVGDGVERHAALLALLAKFLPERSQGPLRRARVQLPPASRCQSS